MRSMTAHGAASADARGRSVSIEIRAVNHRHFELKVRGSGLDAKVEDAITQAVKRRAERGSFSVTVRDETARRGLRVDVELARAVHSALDELRLAVGLHDPVPLSLIVSQPGVLTSGDAAPDTEATLAALTPALETALDAFVSMRRQEGSALADDVGQRIDKVAALAAEIEGMARVAPAEQQQRLRERIDKLLSATGVTVDDSRLATEVAFFADRIDITEELVRLRSHFAQVRGLVGQDIPVGRRLEFLLQELGREINTIGSKSQSAEIAARVIEAKAELEKIREQAANVE